MKILVSTLTAFLLGTGCGSCHADSKGTPVILWTKDGRVINGNVSEVVVHTEQGDEHIPVDSLVGQSWSMMFGDGYRLATAPNAPATAVKSQLPLTMSDLGHLRHFAQYNDWCDASKSAAFSPKKTRETIKQDWGNLRVMVSYLKARPENDLSPWVKEFDAFMEAVDGNDAKAAYQLMQTMEADFQQLQVFHRDP
jgi:hypothetical protein